MADKELTVFVVDLASPADAHHYLYDTIAGKLLKGLKTDYVSVLTYHSVTTNHKLQDTGKFKGIDVLVDFETPSFTQLQDVKRALLRGPAISDDLSDGFQSLIFSVSMFQQTKKKAFTRNIVVITSAESPLSSFSDEKAQSIPNLLKDMDTNLYVIAAGRKSTEACGKWQTLVRKFRSGSLVDADEAKNIADNHPALKKTRPLSVYKGELRLGADFDKILHDKTYDAAVDDSCLTFRVEVYPAAKAETSSLGAHEYLIESDKVVRVERKSNHFVWEKNFQGERTEHPETDDVDEKKYNKVTVDHAAFTPGFKFSNFDLVALDDDLMAAAKLQFTSEFDILGFMGRDTIPYTYFTDEAFFVVPEKGSSTRNLLAHAAFCEALYESNLALMARFVRKQAKEIEVGAMFVVKVKDGDKFTYCFIYIRLPFKEDEKVGNFPKLRDSVKKEGEKDKDGEKDKKDLANTSRLMDDFILRKTLATPSATEDKSVIDNFKVVMKTSDSSKLALPQRIDANDKFLCNSPGINKYSRYLRRILIKSLDAEDWTSFFQNPKFVEENLREGEQFTNFFNLGNALEVSSSVPNQDWLYALANRSKNASHLLVEDLDIDYVRKEDLKKRKVGKGANVLQSKGHYGADEGNYDAIPDFDF